MAKVQHWDIEWMECNSQPQLLDFMSVPSLLTTGQCCGWPFCTLLYLLRSSACPELNKTETEKTKTNISVLLSFPWLYKVLFSLLWSVIPDKASWWRKGLFQLIDNTTHHAWKVGGWSSWDHSQEADNNLRTSHFCSVRDLSPRKGAACIWLGLTISFNPI